MEEEVYNKLEKDGGKRTIYKLARDREKDNKDMKGGWGGVVMKDSAWSLVKERRAVLKVEGYFKEMLNRGGINDELELLCHVEGEVELVEITEEEMRTALKTMN